MRVFISGVDSSPNPDAGIGIARSIRSAFDACALIAVAGDSRSGGLHWTDFDDYLVIGDANALAALCRSLGPDDLFLSSVDAEVYALAAASAAWPRVLLPPRECVAQTVKPARALAAQLGFSVPPTLDTADDASGAAAFARAHGPFVWRKGYTSGAIRVASESLWVAEPADGSQTSESPLLQAHIDGALECLAFAAWRGELLDAVWMRKETVTDLGKTWSGSVEDCPPEVLERLRTTVRGVRWHGGGVFEVIRDAAEVAWLIDANPRFPAWVHGASLCGHNLVAHLIRAATGLSPANHGRSARGFTRVVLEIPKKTKS
ncbi:MAG: hypothetical protein ACRD26_04540 [Vicinamibacterales bacterium]